MENQESREIKVACIQLKTMHGSPKEERIQHAAKLVDQAAQEGSKIILLTELFNVDYELFYVKDPKYFDLAENVNGPTTAVMGDVARKHGVYVIPPIFEKAAPGIYYNAAPLVGPSGNVIANYRKTHVAGVRALEKMYFRAGQKFEVTETESWPNARFSTIICHDRRYPETARICAMGGAEILFCPTAAPGYAGGVHWEIVNRSRAVDNGMFAVYSNRVGKETEKEYFGGSMIVSPTGEVIASAGKTEDAILSANLQLEEVDRARIDVPTLRDLRLDLFEKYYPKPSWDMQSFAGTERGPVGAGLAPKH